MYSEFKRLEVLGWKLPPRNSLELYCQKSVDESEISFPSESYSATETNDEAGGFWATERAILIAKVLRTTAVTTLWEIGAGNGNAAIPLRNLGFEVFPVEPLESGAITLAKNGFPTFHSTLEDLELPGDSISAIGAFDVLEHLDKPEVLLAEIYRVLKPGGTFICSVPAYQWLFSDFDVSIGHYRRYSKSSLESLFASCHFKVTHAYTLFGFLIIPAFVLRRIPFLFGRKRNYGQLRKSNIPSTFFPAPLRFISKILVLLERFLRFPFGLSIICVVNKPQD